MNPIPQVSPPTGGFRRLLVYLFALTLALTGAWAQSDAGSVSGTITDNSGTPLSGALVTINGTNRETVSDRDGGYYLSNVPAGAHTVHVSYLGYASKDYPVTVTGGQRAILDGKMGDDVVQLDKFTVEGQREGQARALNQQRSSSNLKEIVASDAIGRFPDQNASETLQRLSGVALERDQGEGRFISIRGISATLNSTQINGVNVPSSERDTRKVNLDTVSVEQLDGIELTKALTPDMDGDAIGGSVNLKTKTAFSSAGRILNFSGEGQFNNYADKWGHKAGLTVGDKFAGNRWGALLSLSDQIRYLTSLDNEQATGWSIKNGFYVPNGNIDIREYHIRRVRRGANLSLDFRPSADDELFIRSSYNHFSDTEHRSRMLFASQASSATPTSNDLGTVVNRSVTVDVKYRTEDTNIWTVSGGGNHQRGDLKIDWVAAFSHADLKDPFRFEPAFRSGNTTFSYDYSNQEQPIMSGAYQSLALTAYRVNAIRLRMSEHTDEESTFAINVRRDLNWGAHPGYWKVGAKYRAREKNADTQDNRYTDGTGGLFTLANVIRPSTFNRGSTPFLTADPDALRNYFRDNPASFIRNNVQSSIGDRTEDYVSDENVLAGYGMGSVTLDKLTLSGGVRVEHTDFKTSGWRIQGVAAPVFSLISAANKYDEFLPSIHAVYKFASRVQGRASFTQSISRPNFADSAFRESIDDNGDYSRGNVNLKPYHADNFDASIEYYPHKSLGVISAGFFAKRIDDFIFAQKVNGGAPDGIHSLTTPLNGKTATITGLEATYQQQFTFFPSPFDGLGLFFNFTASSSDADLGAARPGEKLSFLQQSKSVANAALSYEKYGFFARVSVNFRSAYLDTIGANVAEDLYVDKHMQIDVTTNYKLRRNVTIYAELLNLNNEPYLSYYGDTHRARKTEYYKWSANAGVRISL